MILKYASRPISRVMSLSDHLSRPSVARRLQRPTWKHDGPPYGFLLGLASNGVYMCPLCYHSGGSLLHCLSTLTPQRRRFISVALVWELPPPDVIRHPALWSPDFPRLDPFVCPAAITWPGCASDILAQVRKLVKFVFLHCHVGGWLRRSHFNAVSAREGDLRVPKPERNAI